MIGRRGLIRPADLAQLQTNYRAQQPVQGTRDEIDHTPVVRLYVPWTRAVWLLSELDEDGIAFGLCDLGVGCPELGYVSLEELEQLNVRGLRVLQDTSWRARQTISAYATEAARTQRIIS